MSVTRGQCDARPTVTFPAARHHRPLAGTKLYCLVCVNNLPRVALGSAADRIRTCDLLIASPAPNHSANEPHVETGKRSAKVKSLVAFSAVSVPGTSFAAR